MGTYIDTDEVVEFLGDQVYALLDVEAGADISANTSLLRAIGVADSVIDDHLRPRYALPIASPNDTLRSIAADIVRLRLIQRRVDVATEEDRKLYEDAMSMLRGIRDGKSLLEFPAQAANHDRGSARKVLSSSSATNTDRQQVGGRAWFDNF